MEVEIVVTGIIKSGDEFLIVKRSKNDDKYSGMWEFSGGHIESGEKLYKSSFGKRIKGRNRI